MIEPRRFWLHDSGKISLTAPSENNIEWLELAQVCEIEKLKAENDNYKATIKELSRINDRALSAEPFKQIEKLQSENLKIINENLGLVLENTKLQKKVSILTEALEFYATQGHIEDLKDDLENPSGEPENWVCDSDDKFNLENGGFARQALKDAESVK